MLLALGSVAIVAQCLITVYWLWGKHERNSLLAAIDRYHQAGEPVLPEDFAPPAHDDPNNPATRWRAAAAALKPLDPELARRADDRVLSVPITAADYGFLRQLLDPNQQALQLAESASRMKGRADWRVRFTRPVVDCVSPDLASQRRLALMLERAALASHYDGDDAEAVDRIRQIVALSRAMQSHPTMIGHLVADDLESIACDTARTVGPQLSIGADFEGKTRPVSQTQLRKLIAQLLDERPLRHGQILAYRTERMREVDTAMQVGDGHGPIGFPLAQRAYGDARIMLDYVSGALKAAQSPNRPAARRRMAALPDIQSMWGVRHLLLILIPDFDRTITVDFQTLADDHLTALLLACRLYAVDHGGAFPARLEDLIPAYVPAVPSDPFTTGSPLRYRGGPDPIVYSVADNGIDDGGSERPTNPNHGDDRWRELDAVTHLKLRPRPAPPADPDTNATPATQPVSAPDTNPPGR